MGSLFVARLQAAAPFSVELWKKQVEVCCDIYPVLEMWFWAASRGEDDKIRDSKAKWAQLVGRATMLLNQETLSRIIEFQNIAQLLEVTPTDRRSELRTKFVECYKSVISQLRKQLCVEHLSASTAESVVRSLETQQSLNPSRKA
jgi:hypothetical protein